MGYDKGVEEIFLNIWRKHQKIDYRFLGEEFNKLMVTETNREKRGTLNTRPPPLPQYSDAEDDDIVEVEPPNEAHEQAPSADAEEEEIASNPPLAEDEPTSNVPDEAPVVNVGEEEPTANTADEVPSA